MSNKYLVSGHAFDGSLLKKSKLYRASRRAFLKNGGTFVPSHLSRDRSLGSISLLDNKVEYNPTALEWQWVLDEPASEMELGHLQYIQSLNTDLFHEQNHRILWRELKKRKVYCATNPAGAQSFLNFSESLVIILDMALADSLPEKVATDLHSQRAIYQSGDSIMRKMRPGSTMYRHALLICFFATFYRLDGVHPQDIKKKVTELFPQVRSTQIDSALERALRIDPLFVDLTNPLWQEKHLPIILKRLGNKRATEITPESMRATALLWLKLFDF